MVIGGYANHRYGTFARQLARRILQRVGLFHAARALVSCCEVMEDPTSAKGKRSVYLKPPVWLDAYLRSAAAGRFEKMPAWWCPWIHDLELLSVVAADGIEGITAARSHAASNFHKSNLLQHILRTFDFVPAAGSARDPSHPSPAL